MFNNKFINKIANNKYLSYMLLSLVVVVIILYPYLNEDTKLFFRKYIRNPNVMIILVISTGVLSFYNFPLAVTLSLFVLLILSGGYVKTFNGELVEGFSDSKRKKGERPHLFMKHFGIDTEKMTNELQKGLEENRKSQIKNGIKSIKKRRNNANNYNNDNSNNNANNNKIAIREREFDLQDDDDTNLINTREICKDIINRINYQYEDIGYLKKYISSRIEEIVDLNNLLENED